MKGYPYNNDIILASGIEKVAQEITKEDNKKKDDGVNTILTVIKDVSDFQTKIEKAIDAQENTEIDGKLKELFKYLDGLYEDLFEIAKVGVRGRHRSIEEQEAIDQQASEEEVTEDVLEEEVAEDNLENDLEDDAPIALPEEVVEEKPRMQLTKSLQRPLPPKPPTIMSGTSLTGI